MAGSLDLTQLGGTGSDRRALKSSSMYGRTAGGVWLPMLLESDGSLGVTIADSGAAVNGQATAADPTYSEGTPNPLSTDLAGYERVVAKQSGAWAVGVPATATSIGKAEDVASADADVGVPAMAVRKATPANTSGTDGDYEMLQISAGRLWGSVVVDTALPAGTNVIGHVINDASAAVIGHVITDTGSVVTIPAAAASIAKAEDAASADGDVGVAMMAVRQATPAATSGTEGDYEALKISTGLLHVALYGADQTQGVAAGGAQDGQGGLGGLFVVPQGQWYNGSTWDRQRGPGNGAGYHESGPYLYSRKTADGQIKGSAGFIHTLSIAPTGTVTAGVMTVYDSLTETGTVIFSCSLPVTNFEPFTITIDVAAATGIYVGYDATLANVQATFSYR